VLGGQLSFIGELTNNSAVSASGTMLTSALPPDQSNATCSVTQGTCDISAGTLRALFGTLGAGTTAKVTLSMIPSAFGVVNVSFAGAGDDPDPNPANDDAAASAMVNASADLKLDGSGPTSPAASGGVAGITLNVSNLGPTRSARPIVTTTLPAGATLYGFDGSQWSCAIDPGTVVCTYQQSQLPMGDAQPLRLILRAPSASAPVQVFSVASVVGAASPDPQPANDSAGIAVTVERRFLIDLPMAMMQ
jgi:hypothetical protein